MSEENVKQTEENEVKDLNGVVNCELLNVRSAPDTSNVNNIVSRIKKDTQVIIDTTKSINDFYYVHAETNVEGYCMKKFITTE